MATRRPSKDLFGRPLLQKRPKYEASLERVDKRSLPSRAARVRWLSTMIPWNLGFVMPFESMLVFKEAQSTYAHGNFVGTVLLCTSFVEHWFSAGLRKRGLQKEADRGLAASIKVARQRKLADCSLLDAADELRKIRNPFVHLKGFDHEHGIVRRAVNRGKDPMQLIEQDAKEAIITMYSVAIYAFGSTY
jgi:hypothetical protein